MSYSFTVTVFLSHVLVTPKHAIVIKNQRFFFIPNVVHSDSIKFTLLLLYSAYCWLGISAVTVIHVLKNSLWQLDGEIGSI